MSYENESTAEIIRQRIEMLCDIHHKKMTDGLVVVFVNHLEKYPAWVLRKAFAKAESDLEKFPTPKKMIQICSELLPSSMDWNTPYKTAVAKDPETGKMVNVLVDSKNEVMFRAQDCPEGRTFLVKLREIAKKLAVPPLSPAEKPWEATADEPQTA